MMKQRILWGAIAALFLLGLLSAENQAAQNEKKSGTITGELKSTKASPNGKNTVIEVLAPGEEKPRPYRVAFDPVAKAPIQEVLTAVRAAQVGDVVKFDWTDTGEGLAIKKFEVVKKAGEKKGK